MTDINPIEFQWLDLTEAEAIGDEWADLVKRIGADVWFTPRWVSTWAKHFAREREMRVLVAHRNNELIGLLPFVFDTLFPFGFPVRLAQLAGTHPLFAVLTAPMQPDAATEIVERALHDLTAIHRRDCVSFAPISEFLDASELFQKGFELSETILNSDTCPRTHTVIPLPESFDAYVGFLSRNRRQKYRKTKRELEEKHNVTTRVLAGPDAAARLEAFIDMHNRQWQAKGRRGHFADWPGSAAFYADYARNDTAGPRLFLQETDAGDVVAALFCFVTPVSCFALVPARNEDWAESRLDIGLHAQFERIEHLIGDGVRAIETGAGEYDYKASLRGETRFMHRFLAARNTLRSRLGMAFLRRHSNLLDLLYYRIWYNRVAPKVRKAGFDAGPLWQTWIRSRV